MRFLFRKLRRHLVATAFFVGTVAISQGQTSLWVNYTGTGTNWSTAANWDKGAVPISGSNTSVTFSSVPQTLPPTSTSFQPVGSYTSTNDSTSTFVLNNFTFNNFGASDLAANGVTITTANATGGFEFQGVNPSITQNGTGSIAFANGPALSDITLNNGSPLLINGSGIGHVTIAGTITDSSSAPGGAITIFHGGATPAFSGGQVFLSPPVATANTFTGGVTLQAGNLTLSNVGSPLGTGQLTVNGGSLRGSGGAVTVTNNIQLLSALNIVGQQPMTFAGVISGNGAIVARGPAVTLTGSVNTTGTLATAGQEFTFPSITLSGNGSAANIAGTVILGGSITLDNTTTSNNNRLPDTAQVSLNSASLTLIGNSSAPSFESIGVLTLEGGTLIALSPALNTSVVLSTPNLVRNNNATFQIITPAGATLGAPFGTNANANFTSATPVANINGIYPNATAQIQVGTGPLQSLVRFDTNFGFQPLNPATDYVTIHPHILPNNPATNYRLSGANSNIGGFVGNRTLNSITLDTPSGQLIGTALYGTSTLRLTSGVILSSLSGGTTQPSTVAAALASDIIFPAGTTGSVFAGADLILFGNITGSNGATFHGGLTNGTGFIRLTGDNSALNGGITVNGGDLLFSSDTNLGNATAAVNLATGPNGSGGLNFFPSNQFEPVSASSLRVGRTINILGGGGRIHVQLPNNVFGLDGNIFGNGRLVKSGPGTLSITTNNVFTGDTVLTGGTLSVTADSNLGNAANAIHLGPATLQFEPGFGGSARNILLTGGTGATLFTNGPSIVVLTGNIGGNQTGLPLLKTGEGVLVLRSGNSINGPLTVGDAAATRRPGADFAQSGGSLVLSGIDGALAAVTSVTINSGATLHLDNSIAINLNRLPSKGITLNGGTLRMTGNTGGDSFEHVGSSSSAGIASNSLANTITLEQPASGGGNRVTSLIATSLQNSSTNGILFLRGTNLGAAGGDRSAFILVAPPAITNGIIPQTFYADSPTANPQDFATTTTVGTAVSVVRFTAYTPLPPGGATGGINYSVVEATQTVSLTQSVNALKLDNGNVNFGTGSVNIGFNNDAMLLSVGVDSFSYPGPGIGTITSSNTLRVSVNSSLTIGTLTRPLNVAVSSLHKFGPGVLNLTGSSVTAGYQISQGTLRLLATTAYTSGQAVTMLPGTTLDTNSLGTVASPLGIFAFSGFGSVNLGSGAIAIGSATQTFGGSFIGTGTLVQSGTSGQTVNGNSPGFSGDVQVLNGSATSAVAGLIIDADVIPSDLTKPGPLGTGTTPILLGAPTGTNSANIAFTNTIRRFDRDITVQGGGTGIVALTGSNANTVTINSNIITNNARRLRFALGSFSLGSGTYTFAGTISGNGTVEIYGGQIAFTGNNTYTGGTIVQVDSAGAAPFGIGHNNAFGTGQIRFAVDFPDTVALRADGGTRTIANSMTIENASNNIVLGFVGQNTIRLRGTLNLNTTGTPVNRTFNVATRNLAMVSAEGDIGEGGASAGITKTGTGTLILSGQNTYTGGTTLQQGVLGLGSNSTGGPITSGPLGTGTLTIQGGTVRASGGNWTVNNTIDCQANFAIDGMNNIIMGGATNVGTVVRKVTVTNTGATTFGGVIAGAGGGLDKDGNGLLIITGGNTYTGGTAVTSGQLRINNSTGSGTGTGSVTVAADGTLEGTGSVGGSIDVANDGEIAGGVINSPPNGILTLAGAASTFTLRTGSIVRVGVHDSTTAGAYNSGASSGGTPGLFNNLIRKIGNAPNTTANPNTVILETGLKINVDASGLSGFSFLGQPYSYKIMELGASTIPSDYIVPATDITFLLPGGVTVDASENLLFRASTGEVFLNFTPIPEPALLFMVVPFASRLRRFRKGC